MREFDDGAKGRDPDGGTPKDRNPAPVRTIDRGRGWQRARALARRGLTRGAAIGGSAALVVAVAASGASGSAGSAGGAPTAATPAPAAIPGLLGEALHLAAGQRGAGPLVPAGPSESTPSPGATSGSVPNEHVVAFDSHGTVVVSAWEFSPTDGVATAWAPGADVTDLWRLDPTTGAVLSGPTPLQTVTQRVDSAAGPASPPSASPATARAGGSAARAVLDGAGLAYCQNSVAAGIEGSSYGPVLYSVGEAWCSINAAILDEAVLWDTQNHSSYYQLGSSFGGGTQSDIQVTRAPCSPPWVNVDYIHGEYYGLEAAPAPYLPQGPIPFDVNTPEQLVACSN